jgi:outer membrane lipoprotein SlyB
VYRALIVAIVGLALLAGCAGRTQRSEPIVDMKGVDPVRYQTDLAECRQYADQVTVGADAATGVVAGGVLGGAVGAVAGNSDTAKRSAGVGAILGGARGTAGALRERNLVLRNCLRNRGYSVLN